MIAISSFEIATSIPNKNPLSEIEYSKVLNIEIKNTNKATTSIALPTMVSWMKSVISIFSPAIKDKSPIEIKGVARIEIDHERSL